MIIIAVQNGNAAKRLRVQGDTMGFDQNSAGQPLVNVHKKTTQVNLWMAAGVAVFLGLCVAVMLWVRGQEGPDQPNPPEARPQQP